MELNRGAITVNVSKQTETELMTWNGLYWILKRQLLMIFKLIVLISTAVSSGLTGFYMDAFRLLPLPHVKYFLNNCWIQLFFICVLNKSKKEKAHLQILKESWLIWKNNEKNLALMRPQTLEESWRWSEVHKDSQVEEWGLKAQLDAGRGAVWTKGGGWSGEETQERSKLNRKNIAFTKENNSFIS